MASYKTVTRLTDYGPFITKLILELPAEAGMNDVTVNTFNVHTTRYQPDGTVLMRKENKFDPNAKALPSVGYQKVLCAYPSDAYGHKQEKGTYVTLELEEERLSKKIEGTVLESHYIINKHRITQLHPLPGADGPVTGLVFDTCEGDLCPDARGWSHGVSTHATLPLQYGAYTPENKKHEKLPLVIWLHGAGEGGDNPLVAYTGNRVTALSAKDAQKKFGGEAYVLAPQSPTVWMDDGVEKLSRSNRSIYSEPLMYLIEEFVKQHEDTIDRNRISVTGCSNGGFMSMRMIIDYPDYFCCAVPVCQAFYNQNVDEETLRKLTKTPIWFVHAKNDELVNPFETTVPIYHRLLEEKANVHFSFFDKVEDPTGQYKDELGRPKKIFNHGVWVLFLDDEVKYDYDGHRVMEDNVPVSVFEWIGKQVR
ncbi:MAG: prolyl oligopeptidase family serine peptidase [Erysipelotrichaceae bacterium]|nr:prolyl oligopeptidase family serine peptidase [Erysipelotrichaceae bacterium]